MALATDCLASFFHYVQIGSSYTQYKLLDLADKGPVRMEISRDDPNFG